MMDGSLVFGLLLLSAAVGFAFGRADHSWLYAALPNYLQKWLNKRAQFPELYLRGLNQLLSEQQDAAIDTFLSTLVVNQQTVETHFALGAVVRRRGQLERAIRIHQNIVNGEGIADSVRAQAQLELALDFDASGLLDRAERLLVELVDRQQGSIRTQALRHLVQLFEKEGEWQNALQTAGKLSNLMSAQQAHHWRFLQAHYCCELACDAIAVEQKSVWLQQAERVFPAHPRATIMQAELLLNGDAPGLALQKLHLVMGSRRYLQLVVPLMLSCFKHLQTEESAAQELLELYRQHGDLALIPQIAQHILNQGGRTSMVEFVKESLRGNPTLPHFSELLDLSDANNVDSKKLFELLKVSLPFRFHCDHCGFEGAQLYWCCPTCQSWL